MNNLEIEGYNYFFSNGCNTDVEDKFENNPYANTDGRRSGWNRGWNIACQEFFEKEEQRNLIDSTTAILRKAILNNITPNNEKGCDTILDALSDFIEAKIYAMEQS